MEPTEVLTNIEAARTVRGIPPRQYMVPFASVPALLWERAEATPVKEFLIYYDAEGRRTPRLHGPSTLDPRPSTLRCRSWKRRAIRVSCWRRRRRWRMSASWSTHRERQGRPRGWC